jgi:hypothetical protein
MDAGNTADAARIAALDELIRQTFQRVRELRKAEIELETMRRIRDRLVHICPSPILEDMPSVPLGPMDAVLDFVRRQPGMHTSQRVAEILASRIHSRAENKLRVLASTISSLIREGELIRDGNGMLSLADIGEEADLVLA